VLLALVGVADADGGTQVFGLTGSDQPLTVVPSADPRVSSDVHLDRGTRVFFIEAMPKAMTVRRVTIGDLARDPACTENPDVDLTTYEYPAHSDLLGGDPVAHTSASQPLGPDLGRITWLVDPTTLAEGHTYAFAVKATSGACALAQERSWAHNAAQVDGGDRACASLQDGSDRLRLWHVQDQNDVGACGALEWVGGFDPSMPSGWEQVDRDASGNAAAPGAGQCASDAGAMAAPWQDGAVVCQFPQFSDAAASAGPDGWYYGLPWTGPGLDGSPRDLYLNLESDVAPVTRTDAASEIQTDAATLNATVNPGGSPTSYVFDWGTDTSYGHELPSPPGDAGEATSDEAVSQRIEGLQPRTTYHYRVTATHGSAAGVPGEDQTFTTRSIAPTSSSPPRISGDSVIGGVGLVASPGGWHGIGPLAYSYRWQRCDATGAECSDIDDATRRYAPDFVDDGATVRVVVTAASGDASASLTSLPSARITAQPPANGQRPAVFGDPSPGQRLTAERGWWSGQDAVATSYAYRWQRCSAQGADCQDIAGADDLTYRVTDADVGSTLRLSVTATNSGGTATAASQPTIVVPQPAVENSAPPTVTLASGPGGDTLTADHGGWSGDGPIAYRYQWQRCAAAGPGCLTLIGETDSSYVESTADTGSRLRVLVTASNARGSAVMASDSTDVLAAAAPQVSTAPVISGTAASGSLLMVDVGSWSGNGPLAYTYEWQRCDSTGEHCVTITGAGDPTYQLTDADVDGSVRAVVTAHNDVATATATTATTATIVSAPSGESPTLEPGSEPTISGETRSGSVLTADPGPWTGSGPVHLAYQWEACNATGQDCEAIGDAADPTYQLTDADVERTLRIDVTASDDSDSAFATAVTTQTVRTQDGPADVEVPAVSGNLVEGQQLAATQGTWTTTAPATYSYQWQSCDSAGEGCNDVEGATDATYTLGYDDAGRALRVAVTATDPNGTTTVVSAPTAAIAAATPHPSTRPAIAGTAREGEVLSADHGSWQGVEPITYSYQWQSCAPDASDCAPIDGATAPTYALTEGDVGSAIRVTVSASNDLDSREATSRATAPIAASAAPTPTAPPEIAGDAQQASSLTASAGAWTGPEPITYAYQWQSCDQDANDCIDVDGATQQTYTPNPSDVGWTLRVVVTATNPAGADSTASAPTAVVTPAPDGPEQPLRDDAPPTISGTLRAGHALSATPGSWSGGSQISYSYQWRSCDPGGQHCANLDGATDATYTALGGDVGSTLRVAVTATSAWQSRSVTSDPSGVIAQSEPILSVPPTLSGSAIDGQTLSADPGAWIGNQISYAYQWQRCDATGEQCTDIAGASASTYTLGEADVDTTERVLVTATNDVGVAQAASETGSLVAASLPSNTWSPSIYGQALQDGVLHADPGSWIGTPDLSYSYQWQRCDPSGDDCADIEGATGTAYALGAGDVGMVARVVVTATNAAGSATSTSDSSDLVGPPSPPQAGQWGPSIYGATNDGRELDAYPGDWTGVDPITYAYQWQSCDGSGENCQDIQDATNSSYVLGPADVGSTMRVVVTATNASGSASARSDATDPITADAPSNAGNPQVWGNGDVGEVLSSDPGWWYGSGPLTYAYQWQRCPSGGECTDIDGATASEYTVTEDDRSASLQVVVTATGPQDSVTATSSTSVYVRPAPPHNTQAPTISGDPLLGSQLTASPGTWDGHVDFYRYDWQRCDPDASNCSTIPGTYGSDSYFTGFDDVGKVIRVVVSAYTWSDYDRPASATSQPTEVIDSTSPTNLTDPTISGTWANGQTVHADHGSWNGAAPVSYSYQWQSCAMFWGSYWCSTIWGATDSSYTLTRNDVSERLRVRVTAHNTYGAQSAYSAVGDQVSDVAPLNLQPPSVSGDLTAGAELSADYGSWLNYITDWSVQWQRCDASGQQCQAVAGATSSSLRTRRADVGLTFRFSLTATNALGSQTAMSAASAPLAAPTASVNTQPPTISGSAQVGQTLYANQGTWQESSSATYDYTWQRCDGQGESCEDIDGADSQGSAYAPTHADLGETIRVLVTATNAWGSISATSEPTGVVADSPPPPPLANQSSPYFSWWSWLAFGQRYDANIGTWNGDLTLTEQWQRCDPMTADPASGQIQCTDIAGASGPPSSPWGTNYTPQAADVGYKLRLKETATTAEDSQTVYSDPTFGTVPASVFSNGGSYHGLAVSGQTTTADPGVISEATLPITTTYQFLRQNDDGTTTELQDGDSASYTATDDDIGHAISIHMVASVWRADHATVLETRTASVVTAPVDPAPTNDTAPSISGDTTAGATLTAGPGSWHGGGGVLHYSYQWQRCEPTGDNCVNIAGAHGEKYTLGIGDVATTVRAEVAAANGAATGTAASEPTQPVSAPTQPTNTSAPAISGRATERQQLTADSGTWDGSQPLTYAYQWQSCVTGPTDCGDIDGATDATYVPDGSDIGLSLRVRVTATNAAGVAAETSDTTSAVEPAAPPRSIQAPSLSILGPPTPDATLTTNAGTWENADKTDLSYQWQRCDVIGGACQDIADNADGPQYQLTTDDIGARLRVEVSAHTYSGDASATSEASPPITPSTGTAANKLVFLDADRSAIYLADQDGTNAHDVIDCQSLPGGPGTSCELYAPTISPTGQLIAVDKRVTDQSLRSSDTIILLNFDGSNPRELIAGSDPAWSADGTRVLYTTPATDAAGDPTTHVAAVDADGSSAASPQVLTDAPGQQNDPDASADGHLLTYAGRDAADNVSGIYVAQIDGTSPTRLKLSSAIGDAQSPHFSPDGTQVIFTATKASPQHQITSTVHGLWAISPDGSDLHPLTSDDNAYGPASVSPDGTTLATIRQTVTIITDGWGEGISLSPPQTELMHADGSNRQPLLRPPYPAAGWRGETDVSYGPAPPGPVNNSSPALPGAAPDGWCSKHLRGLGYAFAPRHLFAAYETGGAAGPHFLSASFGASTYDCQKLDSRVYYDFEWDSTDVMSTTFMSLAGAQRMDGTRGSGREQDIKPGRKRLCCSELASLPHFAVAKPRARSKGPRLRRVLVAIQPDDAGNGYDLLLRLVAGYKFRGLQGNVKYYGAIGE
jgi:hypothetical protein